MAGSLRHHLGCLDKSVCYIAMVSRTVVFKLCMYSDFQASCNGQPKSVERHLHTLMCSVSVVTVVFIYTMEDDQRLNTLVHEGDALRFSVYYCKKPENRCIDLCFLVVID